MPFSQPSLATVCLIALPFVWGLGAAAGWFAHAARSSSTATTALSVPSPTPITVPADPVAQTADEVFSLVNQERTNVGLVPLRRSPQLDQSAAIKGKDLLARHYWSHSFDEHESPWQNVDAVGYRYRFAGENLAEGYPTTQALVQGWLLSAAHRANILKPEYRDVGLAAMDGRLLGATETRIVVAHFGVLP